MSKYDFPTQFEYRKTKREKRKAKNEYQTNFTWLFQSDLQNKLELQNEWERIC